MRRPASLPRSGVLRTEALAGLPGAISSVPDGMAAGVLAGVNPVAGLYASAVGPIAGGLTSSTRRMVITTTSAAALAAGSAIAPLAPDERADGLFVLTILAGAFMAVAGLLRLGRYTRFVSHSVMVGFLTGVAVNIVLGQLPDLTGTPAAGGTSLARALDVVTHLADVDGASLLVGLGALGLLLVLARTPLRVVGALIALVVPTAVALLTDAGVARVDDAGPIPSGFPFPAWPQLHLLSPGLVAGAAAIAAVVLVQGAGVAESAPNDDRRSDTNRDFVAQGTANVVAGLFRGMPVGGSVGQTALNVAAGGRGRWSVVMSGVWMLVILVAFAPVVGAVAVPTLAAVLVAAAVGAITPSEIRTILHAGPNSRVALVSTFVATMLLPIPAAVGVGVVVSLLLQLNQDAIDLTLVERVTTADGRVVEQPAPLTLASHAVTVVTVYGSLFYAGSRTLQSRLPDPAGSRGAALVLRLRGRATLGATFFSVIAAYARQLDAVGGRLYLTGLDPRLERRLAEAAPGPWSGAVRLYPATDVIGESTGAALDDARRWIVAGHPMPA